MKTHGLRHTTTYRSWSEMRQRCNNPNSDKYKWYGARGIRVCDRWQYSFENFYADMGDRPAGHTLDRKDTDGNYEPLNCRWATKQTQMNNMSTNRILIIDAQQHTMAEWSRMYGVPVGTIWVRLKNGWLAADAVQTPVRPHKKYESNNRSMGKL